MQATDQSTRAVYWGTGRRKTSVARVRLLPGTGQLLINGRKGEEYLQFNPLYLNSVKAPLETLGLEGEYDILVNVHGGGLTDKRMQFVKGPPAPCVNWIPITASL